MALAPPFALSRHLSSSCLHSSSALRACSRSTSSLRKTVSHTALNKSRSMNLLNGGSKLGRKEVHEEDDEEDDDDIPWSNNSDEGELDFDGGVAEEDEEEEEEDVKICQSDQGMRSY